MTEDAEETVADHEYVTITRETRAGEPDRYHVTGPAPGRRGTRLCGGGQWRSLGAVVGDPYDAAKAIHAGVRRMPTYSLR